MMPPVPPLPPEKPATIARLQEILTTYDPLIERLVGAAQAGSPEAVLLLEAAHALKDLEGCLAFRTGYMFGLAAKYGEDLSVPW
jgi:hypothetical protein